MLELIYISKNKIYATDQSTIDILRKGFFGTMEKRKLKLNIFEALYLIEVRNAVCKNKKETLQFSTLISYFNTSKKFIAKYLTYKDWRDRGLVIKESEVSENEPSKTPIKQYPSNKVLFSFPKLSGTFFPSDLISIVDNEEKGMEIYQKLWMGQYGSYKAAERGKLNKLDIYETVFLMEHEKLDITGFTKKQIISLASLRRKDFLKLFEVYTDWREKGYVIKTGFKFGTHFRVYFPGATPIKNNTAGWVHSKHVIHVFPRDSRLLISEWARAIRVAHSVRKTFILAVPGSATPKKIEIDFVLYHRRGGEAENPEIFPPKYAMLSLSEEEYIGGREFSRAINKAKERKLELVLAIADRETAVTYYKVKQIKLKDSDADYYEIDWMQP